MFWFIVLLLVVGAGFYFYQKLISIEREIHAEQEVYNAALQKDEKPPEAAPVKRSSAVENLPPVPTQEKREQPTLAEQILVKVNKQPGIVQTDIYPLFPDTNKKQLQKLIKRLADDGKLRREKQGSSYLLFLR